MKYFMMKKTTLKQKRTCFTKHTHNPSRRKYIRALVSHVSTLSILTKNEILNFGSDLVCTCM